MKEKMSYWEKEKKMNKAVRILLLWVPLGLWAAFIIISLLLYPPSGLFFFAVSVLPAWVWYKVISFLLTETK